MSGTKTGTVGIFDKKFRVFADLEEFLYERCIKPDSRVDHPYVGAYLAIPQAQRFYIPDITFASEETAKSLVDSGEVRLPYGLTAVSCECAYVNHSMVVIFWQDDQHINVTCCIKIDGVGWTVMPTHRFTIADGEYIIKPMPQYRDSPEFAPYFKENPEYSEYSEKVMLQVVGMGWMAACSLAAMLSLRNVRAVEVAPPENIESKRRRKGKRPLYSYHVLEVDGEIWDYRSGDGSSGKSIRSHLRRGHIRRLPVGNIWVRACYVHGKSDGFVDKDYAVSDSTDMRPH